MRQRNSWVKGKVAILIWQKEMEEWNFENWGVKYWSKTPEFMQYVDEHK